MKARTLPLAVSVLTLLLAVGCSTLPDGSGTRGAMLVSMDDSSPVYLNGVPVGTTNTTIGGLGTGVHTVTVGDPESPVWSGEVIITGGETVTVAPRTGEILVDGPPVDMDDSVPSVQSKELTDYASGLVKDFPYRDTLPQTKVPEADWFKYSAWGPAAATYPTVSVPAGVADPLQWKRDRVIEVAKHFIGVPYAHYHIPKLGLDCSNFTAWVYNYGFGVRFTSSVTNQAAVAGRKLAPTEARQKGDLLFFWNSTRTKIGHAAIYIDQYTLIDATKTSTTNGVAIRPFKYWYKDRLAYARRIFE